jgi:hypothetical protein
MPKRYQRHAGNTTTSYRLFHNYLEPQHLGAVSRLISLTVFNPSRLGYSETFQAGKVVDEAGSRSGERPTESAESMNTKATLATSSLAMTIPAVLGIHHHPSSTCVAFQAELIGEDVVLDWQ